VKLPTEKVQFNFDTIDRYLLHPEKENVYPADLIVDIKKAYYLSTIIQEEHADNQDLIEKYLSYVYLRILYERDKNYLLTEEYSIPKAKAILTSLVSCKINKDMLDFLEEEFPEEMLHQTIPKEVIRNIDKPYITEHNIKKILPKKSKIAIFISIFKFIIITTLWITIIGGGLFYLYYQKDGLSTTQIIEKVQLLLQNNLPITIGIIGFILLIGIIRGLRNKKLRFVTKIMKQNKQFSKHVKQVCNKKYKTLNYRIKKGK